MAKNNRSRKGELLAELACGMTLLVPVLMYGINLATLGICFELNDSLAHRACRAAASTLPYQEAQRNYAANSSSTASGSTTPDISSQRIAAFKLGASQQEMTSGLGFVVGDINSAVNTLVSQYPVSSIITKVELAPNNGLQATFPGQSPTAGVPVGQVRVATHMHIKYPITLPFLTEQDLYASAQGAITTVRSTAS